MGDSKLVQGLVIAAGIFLIVGIAFTLVEVNHYKQVGKQPPGGALPARTRTTEPVPDTPTAPAPDTPMADTPVADTPVEE